MADCRTDGCPPGQECVVIGGGESGSAGDLVYGCQATSEEYPPWMEEFLGGLTDTELPTNLASLLEDAGFSDFSQYAELFGYDPEKDTYDAEAAHKAIAEKYGITVDAAKKYIIPFQREQFNAILNRLPDWEKAQIKNIVDDWNFSVTQKTKKEAELKAQYGVEGAEALGGIAKQKIDEMGRQRKAMFGEDMSKEDYDKLPDDLQFNAIKTGTIPGGLTGKQINEEINRLEAKYGEFTTKDEEGNIIDAPEILGGEAAERIRLGRAASRTEFVSGKEGLRGSLMQQYAQERLGGAQTRGFLAGATSPFLQQAGRQPGEAYTQLQEKFLGRAGELEASETEAEEARRAGQEDLVQQILKSFESQQQAQANEDVIEAQLQAAKEAGYSDVEIAEIKAEMERKQALIGFEEARFAKALGPEDIISQYLSGIGRESLRLYEAGFKAEKPDYTKTCEDKGQITCPDGTCADSSDECYDPPVTCQECLEAGRDDCYEIGGPCGQITHLTCQDGICTETEGEGIDACSKAGEACTTGGATHLVCDPNTETCISVAGAGTDECTPEGASCGTTVPLSCTEQGLLECDDGTCVENLDDCPTTTCESQGLFECPEGTPAAGTCVANLDDCPVTPKCTGATPFECPDGTCVATEADCDTDPVDCNFCLTKQHPHDQNACYGVGKPCGEKPDDEKPDDGDDVNVCDPPCRENEQCVRVEGGSGAMTDFTMECQPVVGNGNGNGNVTTCEDGCKALLGNRVAYQECIADCQKARGQQGQSGGTPPTRGTTFMEDIKNSRG